MNRILGALFALCILSLGIVLDDREQPDGTITELPQ
jgi:hypothetical protein